MSISLQDLEKLARLAYLKVEPSRAEKLRRDLNSIFDYMRQLDADDETLTNAYASLNRMRKAARQSYEGYADQIRQLRNQVREASEKIKALIARQGSQLDAMAINALEQRRKRIEEFQLQAGTALSESYARAARMQNSGGKIK